LGLSTWIFSLFWWYHENDEEGEGEGEGERDGENTLDGYWRRMHRGGGIMFHGFGFVYLDSCVRFLDIKIEFA
jgi:hypothetical protein